MSFAVSNLDEAKTEVKGCLTKLGDLKVTSHSIGLILYFVHEAAGPGLDLKAITDVCFHYVFWFIHVISVSFSS
jgi:hypothetical protein